MIKFTTNLPQFYNDFEDIIRLFDATYKRGQEHTQADLDFFIDINNKQNIHAKIHLNNNLIFEQKYCINYEDNLLFRRYLLRNLKKALYSVLQDFYKKSMVWGSLTGIRPTKPAYELLNQGVSLQDLSQSMQDIYFVSAQKAELLCDVIKAQAEYFPLKKNLINLYIHIPFCPSKCSYCSFPSAIVNKKTDLNAYLDALVFELEWTQQILQELGLKVYSTYIGGGTPTVLDSTQLARLLSAIHDYGSELTLEAGRADTITQDKLRVAKDMGVNRLCLNPQTFCASTLDSIYRGVNEQQFLHAYEQAYNMGFAINCDLICGLEGEDCTHFAHTLDRTIKLNPHNITVHTLCLKSGSRLKESGANLQGDIVADMLELARHELSQAQYEPYYLYRQKLAAGNHENVGYTKKGFACINNISVMEEALGVAACGAGAISKAIGKNNQINRLANSKDIALYISRDAHAKEKKHALLQTTFFD